MSDDPSFEISVRPTRRFPFRGGVEYEGSTTFILTPEGTIKTEFGVVDTESDGQSDETVELESNAQPKEVVESLVASVLETGPYRYADFFTLPMPVYLLKDEQTGDVFRVSVRDGTVRLHVLPETESAGLRALYDRLVAQSGTDWRVERHTEP